MKKILLIFTFSLFTCANFLFSQDSTATKLYQAKLQMHPPSIYIENENELDAFYPQIKLFYFSEDAENGEFPSQVAIKRYNDEETVWCGGVILDENWVLTSTHCFNYINKSTGVEVKEDATNFFIYSGSVSHKKDGDKTFIKEFIPHENYKIDGLKNDVALLRLEKPLDLSHDFQEKTQVASKEAVNYAFSEEALTIAVGWGKTKEDDSPEILKKVHYPLISYEDCLRNETMNNVLQENMVCFGEDGKNIACDGDSGSGLFLLAEEEILLIGLVTTGSDCFNDDSQKEEFTMITSIYPYKKWIMEKIKAYEEEKVTEHVAKE